MKMPRKQDGVILESADAIILQPIRWLWRGWIAEGKVHLLVGDPGSGKTTLLTEMLAAFSTGGLLPDGARAPKSFCVYWSGEDSIEDTVGVRLKAAHADLSNILILRGVEENGQKRAFTSSDLPHLADRIRQLRANGVDVRVMAIDPLPGGAGNSNSNDDVRRTLEPLIMMAEEEGIAIIGVRHLSKASGKKRLADRVNGSVAYQAVARVVMFVAKFARTGTAPDNLARGVLVRAKSNIGPTNGGFAFTVSPRSIEVEGGMADSTALEWDEQALEGDPEAIVRGAESNATAAVDDELADAVSFLSDFLTQGPRRATDVLEAGRDLGFRDAKLRQALKALGGMAQKESGRSKGRWYWEIPRLDRYEQPSGRRRGGPRLDDSDEEAIARIERRMGLDRSRGVYPRSEDRLGDSVSEQPAKDENHEKVEKLRNLESDASCWEPCIDMPPSDEGGMEDDAVGV